jgi:diketogulonate reductase-like aldo/keto reductase
VLNQSTDYGNEKEAGAGIKRAVDEGIVKREDLIIISKLWNSFHEKERVEPITRQQLEWWGIECVVSELFYRLAVTLQHPNTQLFRRVLHALSNCPKIC